MSSDFVKVLKDKKTVFLEIQEKLQREHQEETGLPYWLIINGLQNEKTGNIVISENVSGDVPITGAFSNQFLEGMKQLYELEPFIKVKPYLTNQWEKNSSKIQRAS